MKKIMLLCIFMSLTGCTKKEGVEGVNGFEWGLSDYPIRLEYPPEEELEYLEPLDIYQLNYALEEGSLSLEKEPMEYISYEFECDTPSKSNCRLISGGFATFSADEAYFERLQARIPLTYSILDKSIDSSTEGEQISFHLEDGSGIFLRFEKEAVLDDSMISIVYLENLPIANNDTKKDLNI